MNLLEGLDLFTRALITSGAEVCYSEKLAETEHEFIAELLRNKKARKHLKPSEKCGSDAMLLEASNLEINDRTAISDYRTLLALSWNPEQLVIEGKDFDAIFCTSSILETYILPRIVLEMQKKMNARVLLILDERLLSSFRTASVSHKEIIKATEKLLRKINTEGEAAFSTLGSLLSVQYDSQPRLVDLIVTTMLSSAIVNRFAGSFGMRIIKTPLIVPRPPSEGGVYYFGPLVDERSPPHILRMPRNLPVPEGILRVRRFIMEVSRWR